MPAGTSVAAPHQTIANLNVHLRDVASNSSLITLASCTGTADTTANVFQKGCIMQVTDAAAGTAGTYMNTGTSASPTWTPMAGQGFTPTTGVAGNVYYVSGNGNGAANAECASLFSTGTTKVTLVTGMIVALKLKNTLQAGANTFNLNGTTKNVVAATNQANLDTAFVAGSVLMLAYTPGVTASGCWQVIGHNS